MIHAAHHRLSFAAFALALVSLLVGCERPSSRPESPPNLVLIVIDTLRADRLSFYGHERETAPFLASIASRSLVFERAHSPSSWTAPAMASLFTSLHPFQHGVHVASLAADRESFEVKTLPKSVATLPESLSAAGYSTFGVTDNQNVSALPGFDRGFDEFVSTNYESAEAVNRTLVEWRERILSSEPYFLYVHYMDPHLPYNEREPWFSENLAHAPATRANAEHGEDLARYDSEIRWVDTHVEALFEAFGWAKDNTVVVVTSDHGEEFGDHGGTQHGRTLYAEVLDIPLVVFSADRWPEATRVKRRVSLTDVAPTFLELAGQRAAAEHVGRSLVAEETTGSSDLIYSQLVREEDPTGKVRGRSEMRAIIGPRFKLVVRDEDAGELFDLAADPHESRDVSSDHPDTVDRLGRAFDTVVQESPKHPPGTARVSLSPKQVKKLKALGYAE